MKSRGALPKEKAQPNHGSQPLRSGGRRSLEARRSFRRHKRMKSPATEPRSTVIYTSIVAGSPKRALQVGGVAGCVGHAHCVPR